jgi:hypothetical protein
MSTRKMQITAPETNHKYPLGHRCQIIEEATGEVWFEAHGVTIHQTLERVHALGRGLVATDQFSVTLRPSYKWPMQMVNS